MNRKKTTATPGKVAKTATRRAPQLPRLKSLRKNATTRSRERMGAGWGSLACEMVELAINDYRTLNAYGLVNNTQVIDNDRWPKRGKYNLSVLHYYRHANDVELLLDYLRSDLVDFTLDATGLKLDGARLRRVLGIEG